MSFSCSARSVRKPLRLGESVDPRELATLRANLENASPSSLRILGGWSPNRKLAPTCSHGDQD